MTANRPLNNIYTYTNMDECLHILDRVHMFAQTTEKKSAHVKVLKNRKKRVTKIGLQWQRSRSTVETKIRLQRSTAHFMD